MFTTGSKLFLGATVLVDRRRDRLRHVEGRRRRLARRHRPAQRGDRVRLPVRRQLLHPRRQRVGDVRRRHHRSACSAAARRAQHVAGAHRRGRWRNRGRRGLEADRVQGRRRACCWPPASNGWCTAGASGPRPTLRTTPTCASACCTRSSSPCSPRPASPRSSTRSRGSCCGSTRVAARSCSSSPVRWCLFGGFLFASKPSLKKGVVTGVCAIAALGLDQHRCGDGRRRSAHDRRAPDHADRQRRGVRRSAEEGPGEQAEIDEKGSQAVAVEGQRRHHGHPRERQAHRPRARRSPAPQNPVTVSRGNVVNVIFKNHDPEKRRLTVNMGEFEEDINGTTVKQRPKVCTTLVHAGRQPVPDVHAAEAVDRQLRSRTRFTVPGVEGLEPIEIKVP